MAKEIEYQWDIESQSDPSKSYKVTLYKDGTWACSCPHWIYRRAECKHIKEAKRKLAEKPAKSAKKEIFKEKNWSLSRVTDPIQRGLIRTDIHIIYEQIQWEFRDIQLLEFKYDENKEEFYLKYLSDKSGINDFIVNKLDETIQKIIRREITIANLTESIEKLKSEIKAFQKPKTKGVEISFISQDEINNLNKIWNNLNPEKREDLLTNIGLYNLSETTKEHEWSSLAGSAKTIIEAITEMKDLTQGLTFSMKGKKSIQIVNENIKQYWDNLSRGQRTLLLVKLDWTEDYARDEKNTAKWDNLATLQFKDKIIKDLIKLKEIILLGLNNKKGRLKTSKQLNDDEILENNILAIICNQANDPTSEYDGVLDKYLWKCLLGDEEYPGVKYTSADFSTIRKKLNELVSKGVLEKFSAGRFSFTYYKLSEIQKTICSKQELFTIPTNLEVPLLENFPNIDENEISKRAIMQVLCMSLKDSKKFKRVLLETVERQFLNFFDYTYIPHTESENYDYLTDDLGLKDKMAKRKHFQEELNGLINRGILVKYPGTYYNDYKDFITFQANYKFIWKTYNLGVFADYGEISDCSVFVNKKMLREETFLKNYIEKEIFEKILESYPRFYVITRNNYYPIYLIYNYDSFELIAFNLAKYSDFKSFKLGFNKKKFRSEIFNLLPKQAYYVLTGKEKNQWKCLKTGEVFTFAPLIRF